jgi:hypothetical protein
MAKRKRRSNKDLFIDKLKELSGDGQNFIGNMTLREALGWEVDQYDRIWDQLKTEGRIIPGRGKGGSVSITDAPGSKTLEVFISYSHEDEDIKNSLEKHLTPLKRLNLIKVWHDRKIMAGQEWDKIISKNLKNASIILLLVSIDFINSKYCYDVELEEALELHSKNNATVIPIIIRPCMWQNTPFAKIQALPKDAKAVTLWQNNDEALTNVAEGIKKIAEDIISKE